MKEKSWIFLQKHQHSLRIKQKVVSFYNFFTSLRNLRYCDVIDLSALDMSFIANKVSHKNEL